MGCSPARFPCILQCFTPLAATERSVCFVCPVRLLRCTTVHLHVQLPDVCVQSSRMVSLYKPLLLENPPPRIHELVSCLHWTCTCLLLHRSCCLTSREVILFSQQGPGEICWMLKGVCGRSISWDIWNKSGQSPAVRYRAEPGLGVD